MRRCQVIQGLEDPEKVLDQAVDDMQAPKREVNDSMATDGWWMVTNEFTNYVDVN